MRVYHAGYFSQFGKVSKVRVSRSKKTGKAKHYAFVEFKDQGIAEIAAAAMDGYFLLKQQVICKVLPLTKVHPKLFVGANRTFKVIPWKTVERSRHDKERTPEEQALRVARLLKRDKQRRKKIEEMGMEYDYPSLEDALPIKPKRVVFSD